MPSLFAARLLIDLHGMWSDLRLAARLLARDSRFTVTAVLVLAIGIAATTTIFTLGNGVYLRDLPFATPDRIVLVEIRYTEASPIPSDNLSFPDLEDLRASRAFDGMGVADRASADLADAEHAPERLDSANVSANMFSLIGQQPVLGRDFTADDDRPGAPLTVMLGYGVWQRRYGGTPDIVGQSVRVNGVPATVIGVMPEGFGFPTRAELWTPIAAGATTLDDRGNRNLDTFGRLAAGVSIDQAEADLGVIMERLAREYPETNGNVAPLVRPFRDLNTSGEIWIVFVGLMGAVCLLLLIACANVANLLLVRGVTRGREIAVRLSLGATRRQIVRQLLVESLLLATVAGVTGLLASTFGVRAFESGVRGTGEPYWLDFSMDWRVFAFVAAACLGTAVLAGLAPARFAARTGLTDVLNEAGRSATGAARARRLTDGFVVGQLAMSLTLLAAAGLMTLNLIRFSQMDAGVETDGLVRADINLPQERYATPAARRSFYRQLDARLDAMPAVRAGLTSGVPLSGARRSGVSFDGRASAAASELASAFRVAIAPGYLEALGVAPVRGRLFSDADEASFGAIAIVNERFARQHFSDGAAVGRTIRLEGAGPDEPTTDPLTIIGVVPNVRQASPRQNVSAPGEFEPVVYVPFDTDAGAFAQIVARGNQGAGATIASLRAAVRDVDSDLPIARTTTIGEWVRQELQLWVTFGSAFGLFGVSALGLSAIGLYGVVAFSVAQRTRELGIRLALGARARHIWWAVTRRAGLQLAVGLALGMAGGLGAGRLLAGVATLAEARDPLLLYGLPALMVGVTFLACGGPVRRAMRLDPATTLRAE